jgi:hypothetical protein
MPGLERLYFRSVPETSPSALQWPDLSFYGVSRYLDGSIIRAEILSMTIFRRAQSWLRSQQFEGADLGIWA